MMRAFVILFIMAVANADKLTNAEQDKELSPTPSNEYLAPIQSKSDSTYTGPSYNTEIEMEKQFYTFSAPEDEFEDSLATQRALASIKQAVRVVFIKGPEHQAFEEAALALARQAAQHQTAIYVLNRQTDIGDLANRINTAGRNANNKPEVHFVKYRTSEDAANAQRTIQSQYDSVVGNSQSINGGFAPVLNFASQSTFQLPNAPIPKNAYLPTSVFRVRY